PALAEHFHFARIGFAETFQDLDGRGLARAVRTEHAKALAAMDIEAETVQCDHVAVALDESAADERVHSQRFYVAARRRDLARLPARAGPILAVGSSRRGLRTAGTSNAV